MDDFGYFGLLYDLDNDGHLDDFEQLVDCMAFYNNVEENSRSHSSSYDEFDDFDDFDDLDEFDVDLDNGLDFYFGSYESGSDYDDSDDYDEFDDPDDLNEFDVDLDIGSDFYLDSYESGLDYDDSDDYDDYMDIWSDSSYSKSKNYSSKNYSSKSYSGKNYSSKNNYSYNYNQPEDIPITRKPVNNTAYNQPQNKPDTVKSAPVQNTKNTSAAKTKSEERLDKFLNVYAVIGTIIYFLLYGAFYAFIGLLILLFLFI